MKAMDKVMHERMKKAMKIEIVISPEGEKEKQDSTDLAPEVKDKREAEVEEMEIEPIAEEPKGRSAKTLDERASELMRKKKK